jgi:hypothetical protein
MGTLLTNTAAYLQERALPYMNNTYCFRSLCQKRTLPYRGVCFLKIPDVIAIVSS